MIYNFYLAFGSLSMDGVIIPNTIISSPEILPKSLLSSLNTQLTGRVVLVCLLKGVHGDFSTRGQDGHAATQHCVNGEVIVVVQTTSCLKD